jgi:hypothetical protein
MTTRSYILRKRGGYWLVFRQDRKAELGEELVLGPSLPGAAAEFLALLAHGSATVLDLAPEMDGIHLLLAARRWRHHGTAVKDVVTE